MLFAYLELWMLSQMLHMQLSSMPIDVKEKDETHEVTKQVEERRLKKGAEEGKARLAD